MIEMSFSEYEQQIDSLNAEIMKLCRKIEDLEGRLARTNSPSFIPAAG